MGLQYNPKPSILKDPETGEELHCEGTLSMNISQYYVELYLQRLQAKYDKLLAASEIAMRHVQIEADKSGKLHWQYVVRELGDALAGCKKKA